MTFQEQRAEGPEDAPSPDFVERLAKALWRAGEIREQLAHYAWADLTMDEREQFLELAEARIRAGEYLRMVCPAPGWGGAGHAEPITLRAGLEPTSHGMCADCERAFAAEAGLGEPEVRRNLK